MYFCSVCTKDFTTAKELTRHKLFHKQSLCHICGILHNHYMYRYSLKYHLNTHTRIKIFSGSECSKTFLRKYDCNRHILTVHKDERPIFICDHCCQRFVDKNKLRQHIMRHLLYNCKICDSFFSNTFEKEAHMLEHKNEGTTKLTCVFCRRIFVKSRQLKQHLLNHVAYKPYGC